MKKLYYKWDDFLKDTETLYKQIKKEYNPRSIIAITKGGLCLAGLLSEYFEIDLVETACVVSYKDKRRGPIQVIKAPTRNLNSPLIVDDVVDSGATMQQMINIIPFARSAVLFYKPKNTLIKPNYYVHETDKWIVYPWEVKDL